MKYLIMTALLGLLTACNAAVDYPPINQPNVKPSSTPQPQSHQPPTNAYPPNSHQPPITSHYPPNSQQPPAAQTLALTQQTLDKYRQQWQQANIRHYEYVFQRGCFCPSDVRAEVLIEVKDGKVLNANNHKSRRMIADHLSLNRQTVDYFFSKIQAAIDSKAEKIEVKYNAQYGYPENVFIDYRKRLADEELRLSAKNLRILPN